MSGQVKDAVEAVNDAAKSARASWVALIAICAYLFTILVSLTHANFLIQAPLRLPIIGTDVAIREFALFSPIILLIMHSWCISSHAVMEHRLRRFETLVAQEPQGNSWREALNPYLVLQSLAGPRYALTTRAALAASRWIAIFIIPFFVYLYFQATFLPYHEIGMVWLHRACIIVALALLIGSALFVRPVPQGLAEPLGLRIARIVVLRLQLSVALVTLGLSFLVFANVDEPYKIDVPYLIGEDVNLARRAPARLFSRNIMLPFTDLTSMNPMEGRLSLRAIDLRYANLLNATLDWADLSGAELHGANLRTASLNGAMLGGADFSGADLYGATIRAADMRGAMFVGANLSFANLSGSEADRAIFTGATLYQAEAIGADFLSATFRGADMRDFAVMGSRPPPWTEGETEWQNDADLTGLHSNSSIMDPRVTELIKERMVAVPPIEQAWLETRFTKAISTADNALFKSLWSAARERFEQDNDPLKVKKRTDYLIFIACNNTVESGAVLNGMARYLTRLEPGAEVATGLMVDPQRFTLISTETEDYKPDPIIDPRRFAEGFLNQRGDCPAARHLSEDMRDRLERVRMGPRTLTVAGLPWVDLSENDDQTDPVGAGGKVTVKAGSTTPVYGLRDPQCGDEAPDFAHAMEVLVVAEGLKLDPALGQFVNGGISNRFSNSCGGQVKTRVIAIRAAPGAFGTFELSLMGGDVVEVTFVP